MKSPFLEKLQVAVVTATLVSAGWIVAGPILLDHLEEPESRTESARSSAVEEVVGPGEQRPSRNSSGTTQPERAPVSSLPDEQADALIIPVRGVRADQLIDTFADERGDGARLHQAIDIMAVTGTSVIAAAPGKIEAILESDAGGNTIYVRSEDQRTIYYYAHLDAYASGLREGMQVRRGQMLGTVGSSGNADPAAPHLHFEIMRTAPDAQWSEPANSINPYPLLTRQRNRGQ